MKIAHYLRKLHLTGGTKVLAQHQKILRELGHEVYWFVREACTDFDFDIPITVIKDIKEMSDYEIDIMIVNKPKDYWEVKPVICKKLVYLCQAFEIDHMNIRCEKKKKIHSGFLGNIAMDLKWWMKKQRIHKMYAEPTEKWCVSPYLMEVLKTYKCPTKLVRNSFDDTNYYLSDKNMYDKPMILSVGDYALSRKNMPFLFDALLQVKKDFHLIRVSPNPITEEEQKSDLISEFYSCIDDPFLSELYRKADILISTSTDEGFGLPVLEAMACGALCLLADIGAYRGFSDISENAPKEYALFFDPHNEEELTNYVNMALEDMDQFEEIINNGIKLSSFYSRDQTVADLKNAIEGLVE